MCYPCTVPAPTAGGGQAQCKTQFPTRCPVMPTASAAARLQHFLRACALSFLTLCIHAEPVSVASQILAISGRILGTWFQVAFSSLSTSLVLFLPLMHCCRACSLHTFLPAPYYSFQNTCPYPSCPEVSFAFPALALGNAFLFQASLNVLVLPLVCQALLTSD